MGTFLKIEVGIGNGSSVDAARKEVLGRWIYWGRRLLLCRLMRI